MPCLRHRSLADIPAACSFKTLMICSSVNLPLRIAGLLGGEQNPNSKPGAFQGSRSQHPSNRWVIPFQVLIQSVVQLQCKTLLKWSEPSRLALLPRGETRLLARVEIGNSVRLWIVPWLRQ